MRSDDERRSHAGASWRVRIRQFEGGYLTGTVKSFDFIQPHPIIGLDVKDESGNMVNWSIEMTSPNHLVRYGWNGHKLKPGDQITVSGTAAKNGLKVLNLRKIAWANGEVIPLGPPPEPGQQ